MIILAWNIRGLGSICKRREVWNVVQRYKCDFLIFCETKLESFSQPLLRSIGGGRLTQWEFLPSHGASGGIHVGWDNNLCSKLDTHLEKNSLSLKFTNHSDSFEWWLSGVYGPYSPTLKANFLDELCHLQLVMGRNWVIGGDFNIIRFTHEYSNRSFVSPIMVNFSFL